MWIVSRDLFLMKKLLKSRICGSVNSARMHYSLWKSQHFTTTKLSSGQQIHSIEWKFYNKFFPKSKVISCNTYSCDHAALNPQTLLSEFVKHKHPRLWLWDPTQSFRSSTIFDLVATVSTILDLEFLQRIFLVEDFRELLVQKP